MYFLLFPPPTPFFVTHWNLFTIEASEEGKTLWQETSYKCFEGPLNYVPIPFGVYNAGSFNTGLNYYDESIS